MIKLISDEVVKKYEFTYLLADFLTSAEVSKFQKEIDDLVKKHKGKIEATQDWGKKALAYKVKKHGKTHADALFTHLVIEFPAKNVQKFEKDVYLNENILRHLLVVAEKDTPALKEREVKSASSKQDEVISAS